jgi:hypothetical protein
MKKDAQIVVRLDPALHARLRAITDAHPAMTLSGLVRESIALGLPTLEARYLPDATGAAKASATRKAA